jgi:hypothetical protein
MGQPLTVSSGVGVRFPAGTSLVCAATQGRVRAI